ncbi:DUF1266 domain-containing protein [Chitinophaga qingshengii]|uniref:DUF1266 domain-containing protein n=1 Tax=Chitinophaga qingshengii TaxID=1569794 RepID=A0ABR7TNE6_9BACT|nr:DUF1266 domain-containing protein [Chitinophaga qingshengii]MBC9930549.1 DUF1266 domain-containing protein [Chitinophaga qingshengii]
MNSQQYMELYWQQLKNLGLSNEAINLYRQQMEQSVNTTDPLHMFTENMKQFNQFFTGDDADEEALCREPGTVLLNKTSLLTQEQQWAVACGADLAFLNGQYLNDITTGISKQECRQLLSEWWDIDSQEELLDMFTWLRESGHRIDYDIILQAINSVSMKESKAFLREYIAANELEEAVVMERLRNTRDALELFRSKQLIHDKLQPDMLIWDFARIINLARAGYDAGYISYEAAVEEITRCIPIIRRTYSSWKHLSLSYQFARCVWSGVEEDSFQTLQNNMNHLLQAPDSPWVTLPWKA